MKKKIVIFGNGHAAEVVLKILEKINKYKILGFTVHKKYLKKNKILGYKVYPFEILIKKYSKQNLSFFIATGYSEMNKNREKIFKEISKLGYDCPSIIDPDSKIPKDLKYGKNCLIMSNVHIHPRVKIGDNNMIWSGAILCHHVNIGNNCWFTSGSSIAGNTKIKNNCFFGINATVVNNLKIGNNVFVGAMALVNKNLADNTTIIRTPDKIYKLGSLDFVRLINNKF